MNLKSFLIVLTVAMGIGILTIMFKNRPQERLVTESIPVSQLSFDEKIAKIPYETATFGMGWFWGPDSQFGSIRGVLRTRAGYCGGDKKKPTYYEMGDHTEAISIDYDPELISYSELLNYFWEGHRCERNNSSTQYQNAVFYRNDEQKRQAEAALKKRAASLGISPEQVATKIIPVKTFTYAEKYHQKYAIRGEIREAIDKLYPDAQALADSTVATRINAYLGDGIDRDTAQFLDELGDYGLTKELEETVYNQLVKPK